MGRNETQLFYLIIYYLITFRVLDHTRQATIEDSEACPPRNLDLAGNYTTFIPFDLTIEILSRLPAKSLIRFQSVSKLWLSIIRSKDFVDSFLTRSRTRPRLLFTFSDSYDSKKKFIFSAPEHKNEDDDRSSTVIARHDMTISDPFDYFSPVNGLICCRRGSSVSVCNPSTRQIVKLPDVTRNGRDMYTHLGYDPVEDQYKVLCVLILYDRNNIEQENFVFTLRSQQQERRKIETINGDHMGDGICIEGAIYYGVGRTRIARFDVRSEKIEFIQAPDYTNVIRWTLVNHQGKLAGVRYNSFRRSREMSMWILQDVEKQEWSSQIFFLVPVDYALLFTKESSLCTGEIRTNEVVVVSRYLESSNKPFSVYYCDLIRKSIRRCEVHGIADSEFRRIHGIGKHVRSMSCFPYHFENIIFF